METGANGWENPESEPKRTPKPCNTCKKKTGRNPEFPPVLWQGQKDLSRLPPRVLLPSGERPAPTEAGAETGAAERHWRSLTPRHALRRAQPCLVAKTFRPVTKNSATAKAVALFLAGAEGLEPSARGFGVDVGERTKKRGRAGVDRFLPQVRKSAVLF